MFKFISKVVDTYKKPVLEDNADPQVVAAYELYTSIKDASVITEHLVKSMKLENQAEALYKNMARKDQEGRSAELEADLAEMQNLADEHAQYTDEQPDQEA